MYFLIIQTFLPFISSDKSRFTVAGIQTFLSNCKYCIRKTFERKNFCVFRGFLANRESFPLNHLLCTLHNGMGLMHHESFPVSSVFCAQPRKFCRIQYSDLPFDNIHRVNVSDQLSFTNQIPKFVKTSDYWTLP